MKPIKILLVDDNLIIRKSFALILGTLSEVKLVGECSDGIEVLPFIRLNNVDIIFMDISMKFMDGFEATRRVKKFNANIKVIGFSALDDNFSKEKMKVSGADGFLSKFDAVKPLVICEIKRVLSYDRMV